ncbi:MAG: indolepyruvate ferredoxin oxidoreductase family protein [Magnetospiraceae bacterium]
MPSAKIDPVSKYIQETGRVFLSGNQAYARLPFEMHRRDRLAGLNTGGFVSGYRGSPFGHFDQDMKGVSKQLAERDITFNPGVNEAMAATAVWGSQQIDFFGSKKKDGVFGLWYGKGPGVDQAGDALRHANLWGTHPNGGVVMAVGDDPMSRSSSIQQQSEQVLSSLCIPVFHASNVQDVYDYGLLAYSLSRYAGVWVAVKTVSDIAESWYMVDVEAQRTWAQIPQDFEIPACGVHIRWPDLSVDQDERMTTARLPAARAFAKTNKLNHVALDSPKRRFGIVTAGKSFVDKLEALEDLGIDAAQRESLGLAVFKVGLIWPLEKESLLDFAQTVEELVVIEESRPFLETQIKDHLYSLPGDKQPRVMGKWDLQGNPLFPSHGEITPAMIARVFDKWLSPHHKTASMDEWIALLDKTEIKLASSQPAVERTPYFCSGCPHNSSTKQPEGTTQLIGIGCHYLVRLMDRGGVSYTQMGGEGATWAGASPFLERDHAFINLGDGTYYHSGSLAVRQAIAAGVNITYKILFNDAVAMTGGQSHDGPLSVASITHEMTAAGAAKVVVVTDDKSKHKLTDFADGVVMYQRDKLETVMTDLSKIKGVTVLIYEQTCATELRRRRKRGTAPEPARRAFINQRVCEGCGDCGVQSNCLSVQPLETEFGRKRVIDQSACNKDFSCLKGFCPSFVTIEGGDVAKGQGIQIDEAAFAKLPEPEVRGAGDVYGVLVAGIGGTGVVTISSLIGEAAQSEGRASQVLDLTGMAQKFGAVYCHLKIGDTAEKLNATRLSTGKANLLIGADIVTSASTEALARLRDGVTNAVVNSHETVTGAFTRDGNFHIPVKEMQSTIEDFCGNDRAHFHDTTDLAESLTGNTIGANIMLLGYACQKGWLPVRLESLEKAIEKNGVAVPYNLRVFSLGRLLAHDPDVVMGMLGGANKVVDLARPATVSDLIVRREKDLVDYQDVQYAKRYRALVDKVANASGGSEDLTRAVARYFYKLMAYKDEYEVARLYSDGTFAKKIAEQFTGDFTIKYHMAPPLLSRKDDKTGQVEKVVFGAWMGKAMAQLAKFKGMRGKWYDPFGRTAERRAERALIGEYEKTIQELLPSLTAANLDTAIEIASIPEEIRGFGSIKEDSMARASERRSQLLKAFASIKEMRAAS